MNKRNILTLSFLISAIFSYWYFEHRINISDSENLYSICKTQWNKIESSSSDSNIDDTCLNLYNYRLERSCISSKSQECKIAVHNFSNLTRKYYYDNIKPNIKPDEVDLEDIVAVFSANFFLKTINFELENPKERAYRNRQAAKWIDHLLKADGFNNKQKLIYSRMRSEIRDSIKVGGFDKYSWDNLLTIYTGIFGLNLFSLQAVIIGYELSNTSPQWDKIENEPAYKPAIESGWIDYFKGRFSLLQKNREKAISYAEQAILKSPDNIPFSDTRKALKSKGDLDLGKIFTYSTALGMEVFSTPSYVVQE